MAHDTTELAKLGTRRRKLDAEIKDVSAKMRPLIIEAAAADVPQVEIMKLTGYSGETIRQICLTPEQAEAEKEARRQRRRKA